MLGAAVGSYLATIVIRWPSGRAARGRSSCDGCGRALRVGELVPLASFVVAGGRCRTCRAAIDRRHPVIELIAAMIGGASLVLAPGAAGLTGALFGWILLALAALDLDHHWLPDRLTALLALLGLAGGVTGIAPPLVDRLAGGLAGFLSLAAIAFAYHRLRRREGMGAGDPKLFGAIGLWLGWQALPFILLSASGIGLLAVLLLRLAGRPVAADMRVPLGTLLAIASWGLWLVRAAGVIIAR